jgi:tetratricopeptide (TPR) repeat protein
LIVEPPNILNALESFGKESTSQEWSNEGNRLFNHRAFAEAIKAYRDAGDEYRAEVASAYESQEIARSIPESKSSNRRNAFVTAANAFERCAWIAKNHGEECSHYAAAAHCYAEINYHQDVVRALKLANKFTDAASYCLDNKLLENAVSIFKGYKSKIDWDTTERIREEVGLPYLESRKLE